MIDHHFVLKFCFGDTKLHNRNRLSRWKHAHNFQLIRNTMIYVLFDRRMAHYSAYSCIREA